MTQRSLQESIADAGQRLIDALHPERIILSGSQVWGNPNDDSDLDFLVLVGDSDLPPHRRAEIANRSLIGLGVPCDVEEAAVVLTPYATVCRYPVACMEPNDEDVAQAVSLAAQLVRAITPLIAGGSDRDDR